METNPKKRVLFVDDEIHILQSLERILRPYRRVLDVTFANGGEAAIEVMNLKQFDVLVTDIRMPKVDGTIVLQFAKQQQPSLVRIALSGQTDMEETIRSLALAHRFLAKPCPAELLYETINRTHELHQLLGTHELKLALSSLSALPSLPRHYQELQERLHSPNVKKEQLIPLIESDIGMSAKILQLVNSPIFGAKSPIKSAREAVLFLDVPMLRNMVMIGKIFEICEPPAKGPQLEAFYHHSLLVGSIASSLSSSLEQMSEAFSAGVLHDVGQLVIDTYLSGQALNHSHLGGGLLALWGLPGPIVEAVTRHHKAVSLEKREFSSMDAVYIAQLLVSKLENKELEFSSADVLHLRHAGLWDRLPHWLEVAKRHESNVERGFTY